LLIAILRQHFVAHEQEAGLGAADAVVALEDVLPQVQMYLGHLGSDSLEQKRLRNLLEQLKGYGLVSEVDRHDQFSIRSLRTWRSGESRESAACVSPGGGVGGVT
jgi:hypothetical protein